MARRSASDCLTQFCERKRFGKERGRPEICGDLPPFAARTDDDDRTAAGLQLPIRSDEGLAAHARQAQIEHHDSRRPTLTLGQRLEPVARLDDLEPLIFQGEPDDGPDLGIVLDEARRNGAQLPVTALVDQFYAEVQKMGGNRWDTSSLIARLEG